SCALGRLRSGGFPVEALRGGRRGSGGAARGSTGRPRGASRVVEGCSSVLRLTWGPPRSALAGRRQPERSEGRQPWEGRRPGAERLDLVKKISGEVFPVTSVGLVESSGSVVISRDEEECLLV